MRPQLLVALMLAGCASPGYDPWAPEARWRTTAPGHELPAAFDRCLEGDAQGLCTKWSTGSGKFRPYDVPPDKPAAPPKP